MENTDQFLNRYQRHIQTAGFGVPGQEALVKARILVIGAGELASPILTYLCSMGVGNLGIVSDERIQKKDLPSQPIFLNNQEGKQKGQILSMQLREINPEVKIKLYEQRLNQQSILSVISNYDLVIDTDNKIEQSLLVNDACVLSGKPMIYGKLVSPTGFISVFNYKASATLRCLLKQDKSSLIRTEPKENLAILAGITGCLMANEAIKIISEIGTVASNKLLVFNSLTNQLDSVKIDPIPENLSITSLHQNYQSENTGQLSNSSPVRSISPRLLAIKIKYKETLQLIDIRDDRPEISEDSWNYLHIPQQRLLNDLQQIHQDIMVILISEDGERAKQLTTLLNEQHGFDNIYFLEGGMKAWLKETGVSTVAYESF